MFTYQVTPRTLLWHPDGGSKKGFSAWLLWQVLCHLAYSRANRMLMFLCVIRLQRDWWLGIRETPTEDHHRSCWASWRIHGQHGNGIYKRGLKQESEQCLTTTVTNSTRWDGNGGEHEACKDLRWNRETIYKNITSPVTVCVGGWYETRNHDTSWNNNALLSFQMKL